MATKKQTRKYPRLKMHFKQPSMTKQSFKDEVNINKIMEKFQRTGAIDHYAKHAPQYGDASQVDYLEANLVISNANTMFEELPSSIRKKFENDPAQFLEFVQDEKNNEEMIELGLKKPPHHVQQKPDPKPTQSDHPSGSELIPDNKTSKDE